MRLSKFLFLALSVTFLSLSYVWQQTEIFRLAYENQKNFGLFQELLDANSLLRYNLKKSTSLVRLGSRISAASDFQMPDDYCLVKLERSRNNPRYAAKTAPRQNLLARVFSLNKPAEARTLSPGLSLKIDSD